MSRVPPIAVCADHLPVPVQLARAVELIGERWAILILAELVSGPRRFSNLREDLPGISANMLSKRLTELEERGLVRRTQLPRPASINVYEATEWALEVGPILEALGRWARGRGQ
jgi:DNA-binding HxlR family transcriptional regulator